MLGGTINVILICGGRLDGKLVSKAPGNVKALLKLGDSCLLQRAIDAIENYQKNQYEPRLDEIAVVGGSEVKEYVFSLASNLNIKYVPEGISAIDNIYESIRLFSRANPILVVSPDLPFISTDSVKEFVSQVDITDEIVVSTITKTDFLNHFIGAKNRFEKIRGEYLTLASIFFFRPNAFITNKPFFEDIFKLRKNPFKLALLLGLDLIIKIILGRASIADIEIRASRLCGCNVRAIRCHHPELAYDIDNIENFEFALEFIKSKEKL